ncbi:MAG: stage II sporulation protein M [Hespellia sp.]|nr:stage II sporulation protein M [Hespellia sp.]
MRLFTGKRILLAAFLAGLLSGILYANLAAESYLAASGIFNPFFLSQYTSIQVDKKDFLIYLMRIRLFPVIVVILSGLTRFRRAVAAGCVIWFGFLGGVLFVTTIIQMGVKGLFLSLVALFPQIAFYVFAYAVILWFLFTWPSVRWTMSKTIFVVVIFSIGILTEVYVNPIFMKLYLNSM